MAISMFRIIRKLLHNNNKVNVRVKGRLGNQMFEYAMARALAIETGGGNYYGR